MTKKNDIRVFSLRFHLSIYYCCLSRKIFISPQLVLQLIFFFFFPIHSSPLPQCSVIQTRDEFRFACSNLQNIRSQVTSSVGVRKNVWNLRRSFLNVTSIEPSRQLIKKNLNNFSFYLSHNIKSGFGVFLFNSF